MGIEVTIRQATPEDAATIVEFNQAMVQETENRELPDEVISSGVKNIFAHPEYGFYLVAEKENETAQKTYEALGMTECYYKMYEEMV